MTGELFGLGLGPGDPELVTLKALRLLRAAAVIAYPAPKGEESFARSIVAEWISPAQREIAIEFPMHPGPLPTGIYDGAAAKIARELDAGRDVAFLCQGDPFFYGSFAAIFTRLGPRYRVTVVPGVSSLVACAAVARAPLVQRDETITVIPATLPEHDLANRLAACDSAAIIKLGRHTSKVRRVLSELGLLDRTIYVERATQTAERIAPFSDIDPASVPYFAMALVRRSSE
ncbi:MAG TPA: precorrin-2 C(20)-methyltransferase [Stellaceae bacterium]|nr:precorrin-2 C(20)-methyltransferase [Stellaceae bacterium]